MTNGFVLLLPPPNKPLVEDEHDAKVEFTTSKLPKLVVFPVEAIVI
jgi:hypothetical protein